jgi:hypothetical protein
VDNAADDEVQPEDDDLPLSIVHSRDTIIFGGEVAQDYRFLVYRFRGPSGDIIARAYLDDIWEVSIPVLGGPASLPADVMAYLQRRFNVIKMLGGPDGYMTIWQKPDRPGV